MRMVIITNTSIHNINQSLLSLSLPHYLFLLAILREYRYYYGMYYFDPHNLSYF